MRCPNYRRHSLHRRGAITVLAAFLLVVLLAILAFAIDLGYMCLVRGQAQNAADSAALAAAWELISEERLRGEFDESDESARAKADEFAAFHRVASLHANLETAEDVDIGRLNNFTDFNETLSFGDPRRYNAVRVTVQATAARGHETRFFFAPVYGHDAFDMAATATAAFGNRISGFSTTEDHPVTSLLPFTLHVNSWKALLSGGDEMDDDWTYDPVDGSVTPGSDGVPELMMYPTGTGGGNWGTVNIGNSNNSTAVLDRQIRSGIDGSDLEGYDGVLELNSLSKTLNLNGDTGISAGMKDALESIIGQARAIPLYRSATGNGNNRNYEIVGFAGIRIVEVKLTGGQKYVMIQPAFVLDKTAIHSSWASESDFVVQTVRLVR